MSAAIAFDSHRFVKNLTACGFTEKQAEVLADEQVRLLDGNLATTADLERVKGELQAEIQIRTQQVKADLTKWMLGALTAQTGLIVAFILGLGRFVLTFPGSAG